MSEANMTRNAGKQYKGNNRNCHILILIENFLILLLDQQGTGTLTRRAS